MPRKLSKAPSSPSSGTNFPPAPRGPPPSPPPAAFSPPSIVSDLQPMPRLIVFDLDYTLWPFWVDTHCTPPLKAAPPSSSSVPNSSSKHSTSAVDKYNETFAFYADVPATLLALRERGVKLGLASRTSAPELARELLKMLWLVPPPLPEDAPTGATAGKAKKALEVFEFVEVYPGSKTNHFERIRKASGVEYEQMLFFDDEARNRNVETLGVTMYLVRDGVSRGVVDEGVWEWRKRRGIPRVPENGVEG